MAWFKKKPNPLSDRSRVLNQQIADLEDQIKRLDSQLQNQPPPDPQPRLRSTALPQGPDVGHVVPEENGNEPTPRVPPPQAPPEEPIFERVHRGELESKIETSTSRAHYNELGVRKYDLPALFQRLRGQFRGPSTTNPKLVSYLAAGGIQGLRPLRYEKRVARNRFIVLVIILFLTLLGTLAVFLRHR